MVAGCRLGEPTPSKSLRSLTLSAKAESLASKARLTALPSRREGKGYEVLRLLVDNLKSVNHNQQPKTINLCFFSRQGFLLNTFGLACRWFSLCRSRSGGGGLLPFHRVCRTCARLHLPDSFRRILSLLPLHCRLLLR